MNMYEEGPKRIRPAQLTSIDQSTDINRIIGIDESQTIQNPPTDSLSNNNSLEPTLHPNFNIHRMNGEHSNNPLITIPLEPRLPLCPERASRAFFWGTFDPYEAHHQRLVDWVMTLGYDKITLAITPQNPYKSWKPAPIEDRAEIARLVISSSGIPIANNKNEKGIFIIDDPKLFRKEWRKALFDNSDWIFGPDNLDKFKKQLWFQALERFVFTGRDRQRLIVPQCELNGHSTETRRSGTTHPASTDYIAEKRLYVYGKANYTNNREELLSILARKQTWLFDCDGTVYLGNKLIPGSTEFIHYLRNAGKEIFFFTNNSSRDLEQAYRKLEKMGLAATRDEIVMSTHEVIEYLKANGISSVYCLGTSSMKKMLNDSGIKHTSDHPQAVVTGFHREATHKELTEASQLIFHGTPWILSHGDLNCPVTNIYDGVTQSVEPDSGAYAALLKATTGKEPVAILGKPSEGMIKVVESRTTRSRDDMVIVGDRIDFDLALAKSTKIDSIFVLSGDNKLGDLTENKALPTWTIGSVNDFVNLIE